MSPKNYSKTGLVYVIDCIDRVSLKSAKIPLQLIQLLIFTQDLAEVDVIVNEQKLKVLI